MPLGVRTGQRRVPTNIRGLNCSKEYLRLDRIGSHSLVTGLPAGGTNFIGVRLHVLDSLQSAESFVHVAAEGKIVDSRVLGDAFFVDEEQAPGGTGACRV